MSACALAPVPAALPVAATCRPHPLGLAALPAAARDNSLQRVFALPAKPPPTAAELDALRDRIGQQAARAWAQALDKVALPVEMLPALQAPVPTRAGPLAAATLQALRSSQPAGSYLLVRVTDYGEMPRRWKKSYVTFEIVSTLAIGAALYGIEDSGKLAGVYLLQETVEELSEGYAGFWAVNRTLRPVRLEAALVDAASGEIRWQGHRTGVARWRWRHLRHMDSATQQALEAASLQQAADHLAADLAAHLATRCPEKNTPGPLPERSPFPEK